MITFFKLCAKRMDDGATPSAAFGLLTLHRRKATRTNSMSTSRPLFMRSKLAATAQAEHQVESGLLLDVVVRKSAAILELLARENQALLVRRDSLLVLYLRLDVLDRVGALHLKGDCLARKGLHEDLHATAQAEHQVESGLLLDVVVRKSAAILELLARENQALLVRRDSLL